MALSMSLVPVVMAAAPTAGSLKLEQQTIRGNSSWTPESYPEIWITPINAGYIIEEKDSEKYPANFLCFPPPEGTSPLHMEYDYANLVNFDTLLQYAYQIFDRHSYELFLEKAEEENILADGSDGTAAYVIPDNRRGRAMLDMKSYFGGTAKLYIEIYDNTGKLTGEELGKLIQDEASRVKNAIQFMELDHFWAQNVFSSVNLYDHSQNVTITVDTSDMILTRVTGSMLRSQVVADGKLRVTEISLGSLMWEDEVEDKELTGGTPYKVRSTDYTSYAFFRLEGKSRDVYLTVKMEISPEDFIPELEKVYPLFSF